MKNRFTAVDVAAIIHDLRTNAVGRRIGNVYDIDGKTYLFKLSGGNKGKGMIFIESGIRMHLTSHDWPKPDLPNGFAMKLRKHLRSCMIFGVSMFTSGTCLERVIDFDFGKHRLIVELYDHGNILLTTDDYIVVYALRPRPAVGQRYPVEEQTPSVDDKSLDLSDILKSEIDRLAGNDSTPAGEKEQLRRWLPRIFSKRFGGATVLLDHAMALNGLDGRKPLKDCLQSYGGRENFSSVLLKVLDTADTFLTSLLQSVKSEATVEESKPLQQFSPCITLSSLSGAKTSDAAVVYDEFSPYEFAQLTGARDPSLICRFETFSEAVDDFFWKQEDTKLKMKQAAERDAAMKRVENVRRDHDARIKQLQDEADGASTAAALLEQNPAIVERALSTVRTAITAGLSQPDIEQLLMEARAMGDPTAAVICKLDLEKGTIKLRFNNTIIDVELSLTGILNTEKMWSKRRNALEKMAKTVAAAQVAIKNAERSIGAAASKSFGELDERARSNRSQRRPFWFEQFAWFVSSDGRLVIAGRDHQQNELLVRRYMATTDIFVHCELHGAGVVLVKTGLNSAKLSLEERVPPPPSTLREAAIFAVARSMAWQEGTPAHAYWVWGNQVSKTPQTGEFVTPGAFIIRGKRNILPLEPLVLGLGVVFVLARSSSGEEGPSHDESSSSDEEEGNKVEIKSEEKPSEDTKDGTTKLAEKGEEKTVEPAKADEAETGEKKETSDADGDDSDVWAAVGAPGQQEPEDNSEVVVVTTMGATKKQPQQQHQRNQQQGKGNATAAPVHERPISAPATKSKQSTRGQKGKMKKIKEKYADQDEEEREARMTLLQSAGNKRSDESSKGGKKKGGSGKNSAPPSKQREMPEKPRVPREPFVRKPSATESQPAVPFDEAENETEGDMRQRLNKQTSQVDDALHRFVSDPVRKSPLVRIFIAESENTVGAEAEENDASSRPLLFALPVCAPYPSLSRCAFRVKVVPGKTKRGKVARAAVEAWQRQLASERQQRTGAGSQTPDQKVQQLAAVRSMLKAVADDEWSKNMPQSCKIMLSGAAQAAATERTKRKQQARKLKQAAAVAGKP